MKRVFMQVVTAILMIASLSFYTEEAQAKSVSKIVIPTTYAKQDSGYARTLKLDVVYTDGTVERITKGVTWSSTTKKVARVGKTSVTSGVPGKTTIQAVYKGKKAKRTMTVSIPSKQNDVSWLKMQQASIFYDGNFYGNRVAFGSDLRKVKGSDGAFAEVQSDSGQFGKWSGDFLLADDPNYQNNPTYDVISVHTSPKFFKRTVTKSEVTRALGTPKEVLDYSYTVGFFKAGEELYRFKQDALLVYEVNQRTLIVQLDGDQVVRAISLFE